MKEKIIFGIAYLFNKRPYIYLFILIFSIYMISSIYSKYLLQETLLIKNLDENKQKTLQIKEKELKPLKDKAKKLTQEFNTVKLEIIPIEGCINKLKKSLGTTEDISCEPNSFIPKVGAEEKQEEKKLLTPRELFYTTKVSDNCHISQNEQSHFTKKGGYVLATDVACDFNKDGKGDQFEVYAPDYLNKSYEYLVYKKHDDLLGDYIELHFCPNQNEVECFDTMKWIIGHTTTKLKDGDIVETGQRIGQSNLTGYTTGFHNHIELWTLIDGKWKNISYTTRSEVLNNIRSGKFDDTVKKGDPIYFTSYNIGDVKQNDSSPNIGASGKDLRHINNPIALTKDIRELYGLKFGDKVKLEGPCPGIYQVEDEMNIRYRTSCISKNGICIKGDIGIKQGENKQCSGIYGINIL